MACLNKTMIVIIEEYGNLKSLQSLTTCVFSINGNYKKKKAKHRGVYTHRNQKLTLIAHITHETIVAVTGIAGIVQHTTEAILASIVLAWIRPVQIWTCKTQPILL